MLQTQTSFKFIENVDFNWISGQRIQESDLLECANLYSQHYGIWTKHGLHPGENIKLSKTKLHQHLNNPYSTVVFAKHLGQLIAYVFSLRLPLTSEDTIIWVTQLVVHSDYRKQGIAKHLLMHLWSFSNNHAWGLLTASPYAVRALEKATRRRCDPNIIAIEAKKILDIGKPYLLECPEKAQPLAGKDRSVINTKFFVSHRDVNKMIAKVSQNTQWKIGVLEDGYEWFAFTFKTQNEFPISPDELDNFLTNVDNIAKRAYEGMTLNANHTWTNYTSQEVDFIIDKLDLHNDSRVLDFGCGNGRHTIGLAQRGYFSTGVDFAKRLIDLAKTNAQELLNTRFIVEDCRRVDLNEQFDAAICIYDVIGTFPEEKENFQLLTNLTNHLKKGSKAIISVLNFTPTWNAALYKYNIYEEPWRLLELPPSNIMENTGQIFDPQYYLIDTKTKVVYRKEQFSSVNSLLPGEYVIRDYRYTKHEIVSLCEKSGLRVLEAKPVQTGNWSGIALAEDDPKAKEILVLVEKE